MALSSIANSPPPSSGVSQSLGFNVSFDNSGFVTTNGAGSASATNTKTALPSVGQVGQYAAASVGGLLANPAFVILAGLGLFLYLKHK